MEERKPQRLNTRISAELNEWLDKKAKEMGVTKSALVAIAVENYRKEHETVTVLPQLLEKLKELGVKL